MTTPHDYWKNTTERANLIARSMSYNDDYIQAEAKALLIEMSMYINRTNIRVSKKKDGYLIIDGNSNSRYMTFKETMLYKLFNLIPNKVKQNEPIGQKTYTPAQLAKKHNVDISVIIEQLCIGIKVEKEHTSSEAVAREIALDHLLEDPIYYTKLIKMEKGK